MKYIIRLYNNFRRKRLESRISRFMRGTENYVKEKEKIMFDSWKEEIANTGLSGSRNNIKTTP